MSAAWRPRAGPPVKSFLIRDRASLDEELEVLLVGALGGGDEEDQVRGAVLGAEVDRWDSRAMASVGSVTAAERQCGMARPAGDAGGGLLLRGPGRPQRALDLRGAAAPKTSPAR